MKHTLFYVLAAVVLSTFIIGCDSGSNSSSSTKASSLGRDYREAPDVIQGAQGMSVHKENGELSRAVEPNNRIEGLNGLNLK